MQKPNTKVLWKLLSLAAAISVLSFSIGQASAGEKLEKPLLYKTQVTTTSGPGGRAATLSCYNYPSSGWQFGLSTGSIARDGIQPQCRCGTAPRNATVRCS